MNTISAARLNVKLIRWYKFYALTLLLLTGTGMGNAQAFGKSPAIDGYDPVAYFTMQEAKKGKESIEHKWLGEKWRFVNEDHKAQFVADPIKFMPNYGGYCSYDPVSAGHDHLVDPTAWRIVDDALYLFYSEESADHAMPEDEWAKVKNGLAQ
jgi:hypothetical protein